MRYKKKEKKIIKMSGFHSHLDERNIYIQINQTHSLRNKFLKDFLADIPLKSTDFWFFNDCLYLPELFFESVVVSPSFSSSFPSLADAERRLRGFGPLHA